MWPRLLSVQFTPAACPPSRQRIVALPPATESHAPDGVGSGGHPAASARRCLRHRTGQASKQAVAGGTCIPQPPVNARDDGVLHRLVRFHDAQDDAARRDPAIDDLAGQCRSRLQDDLRRHPAVTRQALQHPHTSSAWQRRNKRDCQHLAGEDIHDREAADPLAPRPAHHARPQWSTARWAATGRRAPVRPGPRACGVRRRTTRSSSRERRRKGSFRIWVSRACGSNAPCAPTVIVLEHVAPCRFTPLQATLRLLPAGLLADPVLAAERGRGSTRRTLWHDADESAPASTGSGACGPPGALSRRGRS
jgi:hypothetical protein